MPIRAAHSKKRSPVSYVLGALVFIVLMTGVAAAALLPGMNFDLRNQAASERTQCIPPARPLYTTAVGDPPRASQTPAPTPRPAEVRTRVGGNPAPQARPRTTTQLIACECPDGSRVAPGQPCRTFIRPGGSSPRPSMTPRPIPVKK